MRVETFGQNTFYESEDQYRSYGITHPDKYWYRNWIIGAFTSIPQFDELSNQIRNIHNLNGYSVLSAHGGNNQGRWIYADDGQIHPVIDWVKEVDGTAIALFLIVCNPNDFKIRTEKSLILSAYKDISLGDLPDSTAYLRMYSPIHGDMGIHRTTFFEETR